MAVIKIYNWTCEMPFSAADIGYRHSSVSGVSYFSGRPQGSTLALPKRMTINASGPLPHKGVAEVIRYALEPNNLVRMPDPNWAAGRSDAVASIASDVSWADGAQWADGARWGAPIALDRNYNEGAADLTLLGLPKNETVFLPGDVIGIDGQHYVIRAASPATDKGVVTVKLVRGLTSAMSSGAGVEFPVRHLFDVVIPVPTDRNVGLIYDWQGTFTETFKSEFSGVTFEDASFFE